MEILSPVLLLTTLPAIYQGGIPVTPVTVRFALQTLFRYISTRPSQFICCTLSLTIAYFLNSSSPFISAIYLASSIFHSGISIQNWSATLPVLLLSTLSNNSLTILNVSGTIPPTSPEWQPSLPADTLKSTRAHPLRLLVSHNQS